MSLDFGRVYPEAQTVLRMFLDEVDRVAPGHVTAAYIGGSLALDDARPGKSDIDLVLVREDGASNEASMAALRPAMAMVRDLYPEPALDGILLTRDDLRTGPDAMEGPRPVIFEGAVTLSEGGSARNPVTWQTLRQGGITWRGTPLADLALAHDDERLREWTRENLLTYWRPLHRRTASLVSQSGQWSLRADFAEWVVLGVTRLHATIRTGEVVSKTAAGTYALETFDERWHRIIREAVDIRTDPERKPSRYGRDILRRRRDTRAYLAMVIEDALAL